MNNQPNIHSLHMIVHMIARPFIHTIHPPTPTPTPGLALPQMQLTVVLKRSQKMMSFQKFGNGLATPKPHTRRKLSMVPHSLSTPATYVSLQL